MSTALVTAVSDGPPTLASNSRWNILAFAFTLAAHFVTVPFVIAHIGLSAFGRAGLVLATWAPLVLVGTVLGQAATREIAGKISRNDAAGAASVAATAWTLCAAASLTLGVSFAIIGPWLLSALVDAGAHENDSRKMFLIAACGWAAQQGTLVFQGFCAARQDYRTVAKVGALGAALTVALTLGCTAVWPTSAGYLLGVSASFAALLLVWWIVSRRATGARWPSWGITRHDTRALFNFGKWQSLAQLAGTVSNQIDRYLLAGMAPAAVIGQYNAANRLQEAVYAGVMKAGEVLFPHFGATAHHDASTRTRFFVLASWVVMSFSAIVLAPLIALADPFLRLWAGAEVADGGAAMLQLLVLGGLIGCGSNVFTYHVMGRGNAAILAGISLVYSVLTIVFSLIVLNIYGPIAAGGGLAIASVARVGFALWMVKRHEFPGMPVPALLVSSVLPLAAGAAVAGAALVSSWPLPQHWLALLAAYAACSVVTLLVVLGATSTTRAGRDILSSVLTARRRGSHGGRA